VVNDLEVAPWIPALEVVNSLKENA